MEYTLLGKSDLRISRIGFGCMSLPTDQKESEKLLKKAIDQGINFFDTADLYEKSENEIRLGRAIKDHRKNIILATKVGNQWRPDGSGWDWNPHKSYIIKAVEDSLKRLQTDYIDLYQLHGGTIEDPRPETIEAFEQLKQEGKIRYYGISSIRPNVIREFVEHSSICSVMTQYSLLDWRPEESIIELLQKKGIGVLTRGSIAQGLLAGKDAKNYLNLSAEEVKIAADAIREVSGNFRTQAQSSLLYVLRNPALSAAVVGIRSMEQLEDAIGTFSVPALSSDEMKFLRNSVQVNFYTEHR